MKRNLTPFLIVALVIAGSAVVGVWVNQVNNASGKQVINSNVNNESVSISTISFEPVIQSTTNNGLELTATILTKGQNVSVSAEVNNTLSTYLKVDTMSMSNPAYGPCQRGIVTGIRVFLGRYSIDNISKAQELPLYNPSSIYLCPMAYSYSYDFSPNSAIAAVTSFYGDTPQSNWTRIVQENSVVTGYWTGSGQNYAFNSFVPGTYTILTYDAWGNDVILYFQVGI